MTDRKLGRKKVKDSYCILSSSDENQAQRNKGYESEAVRQNHETFTRKRKEYKLLVNFIPPSPIFLV